MGLDERHTDIVGFLFRKQTAADPNLQPAGTGFIVAYARDDKNVTFFVTARHVVEGAPVTTAVIRERNGNIIQTDLTDWQYPPNASLDLAIHPLVSKPGDPVPSVGAWQWDVTADKFESVPRYGERVYWVGLHGILPDTWDTDLIPMVRTGNLAAPSLKNHRWYEWNDPNDPNLITRTWGPHTVHLVGSTVVPGYSGSPVFMETRIPGPVSDKSPPLHPRWTEDMEAAGGPNPDDLLGSYSFHALLGIAVAGELTDAGGLGTVLASGYLTKFIESQPVQDWIDAHA